MKDGWIYSMQSLSIKEQLELGVRGIMLDIYGEGENILLCHGGCGPLHGLQRSLTTSVGALLGAQLHPLLADTLYLIQNWLCQNPQEIVTLFFESYIPITQFIDART
jgi:hypothetical protein